MTEDWAAISLAINERMTALKLTQRALVERSQVSKATVAEIRNNVARRRRSSRTLEALSIALDWHPQHLEAVLGGQRPPDPGEPVARTNDTPARLAAIEYRLERISDQLAGLEKLGNQLDAIDHKVEIVVRRSGHPQRDTER